MTSSLAVAILVDRCQIMMDWCLVILVSFPPDGFFICRFDIWLSEIYNEANNTVIIIISIYIREPGAHPGQNCSGDNGNFTWPNVDW